MNPTMSRQQGTLVLARQGTLNLSTVVMTGIDPLASDSPATRQGLERADTFPNAPDIMLIGTYWPETDEVAAFQDFVGSHGGAGGEQARPFIIYPSSLPLDNERIIGAESVYRIFKSWASHTCAVPLHCVRVGHILSINCPLIFSMPA